MKYFQASVGTILVRFYMMMGVAFIAGFAGVPWLALLCLPILLSAMLGIKFEFGSTGKQLSSSKVSISKRANNKINQAA